MRRQDEECLKAVSRIAAHLLKCLAPQSSGHSPLGAFPCRRDSWGKLIGLPDLLCGPQDLPAPRGPSRIHPGEWLRGADSRQALGLARLVPAWYDSPLESGKPLTPALADTTVVVPEVWQRQEWPVQSREGE